MAVAEAAAAGPCCSFHLHPLCGALPIHTAWEMLERWVTEDWPPVG